MTLRIDDSRRVRALGRTARRALPTRSRPWWRRRARRPEGRRGLKDVVWRSFLTLLTACCGLRAVSDPIAVQMLSLSGLVFMQGRIVLLRNQLGSDSALATLAQLPVPQPSIFNFQLRRQWLPALWTGLDAAGFWAVVWSAQGDAAPWAWLPIVAFSHVAVTDGMARLLAPRWPTFSLTLLGGSAALGWATMQGHRIPWLWTAVEPVLHAIRWLTPWGWLNAMAGQMPRVGFGPVILLLGGLATWCWAWSHARMRASWRIDPRWREVAGRPPQTWQYVGDDLDMEDAAEPVAPDEGPARVAAADPQWALAALSRARDTLSGQSLNALGWAGARTLRRCSADERWLVDRLGPRGGDDVRWRWALLLAALPAAAAVAGVSPRWALGGLALVLLARGMPRGALLLALPIGFTFVVPPAAWVVCNLFPCVIAVLISIPLLGGTWTGLPMGSSVLGQLPRSWWSLMRIMLTLTGLRLVAGIPITTLVILALHFGIGAVPAAVAATGSVVVVLWMPCLCASRIIQRTPGGLDTAMGRRLLSFGNLCCVLIQMAVAVALFTVTAILTVNSGTTIPLDGRPELSALLIPCAAIALSLVTSAAHLALLRHAYRRTVDLIPIT